MLSKKVMKFNCSRIVKKAIALSSVVAFMIGNAQGTVSGLSTVAYGASAPAANWNNISDYSYIAIGNLSNSAKTRGSVYVNGNITANTGGIDDHTGNDWYGPVTKSYLNGSITASAGKDGSTYEGEWKRQDGSYWYKAVGKDAAQNAATLSAYWNEIGQKYGKDVVYKAAKEEGTEYNYLTKDEVYYYAGTGTLNWNSCQGVLIAPNADVKVAGKGWHGTVVANNISVASGAAAHSWKFTGAEETVAVAAPAADKAVEKAISFSEIVNALDVPLQYGAFCDKYNQNTHSENTFCANDVYTTDLAGLQLDGSKKTYLQSGTVQNGLMGNVLTATTTYLDDDGKPVAGATVKLKIVDQDGAEFISNNLVTDANGIAKCSFYANNGTYKLYVSRVTETQEPTYTFIRWTYEEGSVFEITGYNTVYKESPWYDVNQTLEDGVTVEFTKGSTTIAGNKYSQNISYAHNSLNFSSNLQALNTNGIIVAGTEAAFNDIDKVSKAETNWCNGKTTVKVLKAYAGEANVIDINKSLKTLEQFSVDLVNSKSSSDVNVYNYTMGELSRLQRSDLDITGKKLIVINVDVTNGQSLSYSNLMNSGVPDSVRMDPGIRMYGEYANQAAKMILNFYAVDENGKPYAYDGEISISETCGVVLAPAATINQGTFQGTLIAKNVKCTSENHQISMFADRSTGDLSVVFGPAKAKSSSSSSTKSSSSSSVVKSSSSSSVAKSSSSSSVAKSSSSSVKTTSSSSEKATSSSSVAKSSSSSSVVKSSSSSSVAKSSSSSSEVKATSSSSAAKSSSSSAKTTSSSSEKATSSSSVAKSSSSSSVAKSSSSSSEVKATSSSSVVKSSSSSSVAKSSSSSSEVKATSSSSVVKSSSSSAKTTSSSSEKATSSSSVAKSSSSSSESKSSSSSSESKSSSSSSESKSSSSSSEVKATSSSSVAKSSSSSSEVKDTSSSSEVKDTSSSSEVKDTSSSSEVKDTSSSSEVKDTSSSSEVKDTSSSSEVKDTSSSSEVKDTSSSSEVKDTSSSSEVKDTSSSSEVKDTSSSSEIKSTTSSSKSKNTSSKKKKKKSSSSDKDTTVTTTTIMPPKDTKSASSSSVKKSGTSGSKKTVITKTADVLGEIAAPVIEAASGVLGDIAAPLTGDDMNPTAWLALAIAAAGILVALIVISRKQKN